MIDAKNYLRQVENIDLRIQNKLIEQQQWRDIALGITASVGGERVQSSSSQQKMADAIEKCVDMEREIDTLIDRLIETKRDVIATIEKLDNPTEYDVLHKRYIQFLSLQDIADMYKRDYTTITTTHGRALKNVQTLLDRGAKSEKVKS
jgi:DNA-directed RNA polymerase specialized sigma24 family protein